MSVLAFDVCGYHLQSENDGQAVATAAFPVPPEGVDLPVIGGNVAERQRGRQSGRTPRYFAASMDESIIVGYYTSAEVLSQRKQYLTYL